MAIIYSIPAINGRLNGLVTAIGSSGVLRLLDGATTLAEVTLGTPCGTVAGGTLTFSVPRTDVSANASGNANAVRIEDSIGTVMISGLTVGIPLSGANVILSNGLNTLAVTAGQQVTLISGQIIGS